MWRVIYWQAISGAVAAIVTWGVSGAAAGLSAAYGALTVVLPSILMARLIAGPLAKVSATAATLAFFIGEAAKLTLSGAMLLAASHLFFALSWPALLLTMVFTLKTHWLHARLAETG